MKLPQRNLTLLTQLVNETVTIIDNEVSTEIKARINKKRNFWYS